jgi:hypothetical protein
MAPSPGRLRAAALFAALASVAAWAVSNSVIVARVGDGAAALSTVRLAFRREDKWMMIPRRRARSSRKRRGGRLQTPSFSPELAGTATGGRAAESDARNAALGTRDAPPRRFAAGAPNPFARARGRGVESRKRSPPAANALSIGRCLSARCFARKEFSMAHNLEGVEDGLCPLHNVGNRAVSGRRAAPSHTPLTPSRFRPPPRTPAHPTGRTGDGADLARRVGHHERPPPLVDAHADRDGERRCRVHGARHGRRRRDRRPHARPNSARPALL